MEKKYYKINLIFSHFRVAKPEQIGADLSDSNLVKLPNQDLEIIHTYTLHNKGPSDAKRTELKLMWPMLPLAGFNDQSLLYGNDLPSIIRMSDPKSTNDRCYIYQPVRSRFFFRNILQTYLDNKLSF